MVMGFSTFGGDFGGGFCVILMGRQAMEMKWKRFVGSGERGAWSKEKRRSFERPSQTRKKAVGPPRWKVWRSKGRIMKM
ncbi:hypothetical protein L484_014021 [Morus notabilis]|uniref:Uncharacterized protein n=1 Tax=Morus notabilis TaxID=981085 RepID=W9S0F8_9ROSA|nr:hypothetical protein L484_014021 [Morus notabilis]